jgi:TetR/AcrR family transcriptional regulator, regulator of mycofactocin system
MPLMADQDQAAPSLVSQLRAKRSELMVLEVEATALRLFEARGFGEVTVDEIAEEAGISVRTFYRYFATKEDVLQSRIDQRAATLRAALAARPTDEPPLHSLRLAYAQAVSAEDPELRRRWTTVVAASPNVLKGVLGGILLKTQRVIAEFFAARFEVPSDSLGPLMLAAAAQGVVQAAQTHWFINGGDLASTISDGLELLERGSDSDPRTWSQTIGAPPTPRGSRAAR